ncbi:MAG: cobalamin biosynthesis protein [Bacteroides sp.]|nr:cobalamin biosynthesis protein [Bacteroides sp.]
MGNVFPPFKVDIAGMFCTPAALQDARTQYQNGQISLHALQAVEDAEIRNLVERLESGGMKVVSDGGFRSRDFLEGWDGICCKPELQSSSAAAGLQLNGRISLSHHPVWQDFAFLSEVTADDVLPKQHIPSPGKLLMRIFGEVEAERLKQVYPDVNVLLDDLAVAYKKILMGLYEAGCRYVQFDGVKSMLSDEAVRLNNRVLRERPEGLFIAFHAATDMLIRLHGADAYFLSYDSGICDRSRLLWFLHEKEAMFGLVVSYYPEEDELDELQAKIEEVLNYIPLKRFTLCLPDADSLLHSSETDEEEQWKTIALAKEMAMRLFSI